MSRFRVLFLFLALCALGLAGCAGADEPRRIAVYPSGEQGSSGAGYEGIARELVFSAYLELEVEDADFAAGQAGRLAENWGGAVTSWQRWKQAGRLGCTLTLEVPWRSFESLRAGLIRLGTLKREQTTGEWIDPGSAGRTTVSQITLVLVPASFEWPQIELPGWRPLRTLQRALGVSLGVFGFLLDVIIWVVVVGGPFMLLGWGLKKLFLRLRR